MESEKLSGTVLTDSFGNNIELTREQNACINFKGEKTDLIVKGAAGSGKSLVLMSKATKILNAHTSDTLNEIIIFSYTNSLTKYAQEFLDPNNEKSSFIKICTLDLYIQEIAKSLEKLPDYPLGSAHLFYDEDTRKRIIKKLIEQSESKHRFFNDISEDSIDKYVDFWSDEFQWMMNLGILGSGTVFDLNKYLILKRTGRGHFITMSDKDRQVAYDFFNKYQQTLKDSGLVEPTIVHIFVKNNLDKIKQSFKYRHVMVDDAQDLPIIDLLIAKKLSTCDVLFAMDENQRIYRNHWMLKDLGIYTTTIRLKKSFRYTIQIDQFAEKIRKISEQFLGDDDRCDHIVSDKIGPNPIIMKFNDSESERCQIIHLVEHYIKNKNNRTAIILRLKDEIEQWSGWLSKAGISHDKIMGKNRTYKQDTDDFSKIEQYSPRKPGLKLCTIHSAKGLEFENVIIPHFTKRKYPEMIKKEWEGSYTKSEWIRYWRNLTYVAMTRSMCNLVISYYGKPSIFLDEIYFAFGKYESNNCEFYDYLDFTTGELHNIPSKFLKEPKNSKNTKLIKARNPTIEIKNESENLEIESQESTQHIFNGILKNAKEGNPDAIIKIANFYYKGIGVPKNIPESIRWYEQLKDKNKIVEYSLSKLYLEESIDNIDVRKINSLLISSASKNYIPALLDLSQMFKEGTETVQCSELSFRFRLLAANAGDADSQIYIAHALKNGNKFVKENKQLYKEWLIAAAENESVSARSEFDSDPCNVNIILSKPRKNNNIISAIDLRYIPKVIGMDFKFLEKTEDIIFPFNGNSYIPIKYDGVTAFSKDCIIFSDPFRYFRSLKHQAISGYTISQFNLALCYYYGVGTEKDENNVVKWLKKSSKNNYKPAKFALAKCYRKGIGVNIDKKKSIEILKQLSEEDYKPALLEYHKLKNII